MATESECKFYKHCGFVKLRKNPPDPGMVPLPDNGDCGRTDVKGCPRRIYASTSNKESRKEINKIFGHGITNTYTEQSLINKDEMEIVYPSLVQDDGNVRTLFIAENHN